MDMNVEREGSVETIRLSRRPSTVALVVIAMGVLLVLQVLIVLLSSSVALPLMALLLIAAGSAGWLSILALEAIMPITVKMNKDGITIERLLGEQTYPWIEVGEAKVVPSSGMLSDDPQAEPSGRLGVGLFLKSRKTPRLHELDADIMVFGAGEAHLNDLIKIADRIVEFKNTIGAGLADPMRRIRRAAPIATPTTFRRPRAAG